MSAERRTSAAGEGGAAARAASTRADILALGPPAARAASTRLPGLSSLAGPALAPGPGGPGATGAGSGSAPRAAGPGRDGGAAGEDGESQGVPRTVVRTVRDAVEVIPAFVWALIAGLGAFSLLAAALSALTAARARRLAAHRAALLSDVGLLQEALLPAAPGQVPGAVASAAYRPAAGGPAGGDFHDVFAIDGERLGMIVGRVSAGGRRALGVTALIRHVLRAYVEGGLQPRNALHVGAGVLESHLGPDYATVTVGVYDRVTSELTYAGAGMPVPVILGAAAFEPVTACAAPPIGMGLTTGTRQTTIVLPEGASACFFTDGLLDARLGGERYGYRRAWRALESLDDGAGADELLDRVATEADIFRDDVAAVLLRVGEGAPAATSEGERRIEELELAQQDLGGERPVLFLRDCGVPSASIFATLEELRQTGLRVGGLVLRVRFGAGVPQAEAALRTLDVLQGPANGRPAPQVSAASRPSGG